MTLNEKIEQYMAEFEKELGADSELGKFLALKYGTHIHPGAVSERFKDFLRSHLESIAREAENEVGAEVRSIIDKTRDEIDPAANGIIIEKMAEKFAVPVSVMATRLYENAFDEILAAIHAMEEGKEKFLKP